MQRPVSPLLHDYKSTTVPAPKKPKAVQWFVVGLGIPLLGLALLLLFADVLVSDRRRVRVGWTGRFK